MVIHNSQATLRIACLLVTVSANAFANAADVHPQDTAQLKDAGRIVGRVLVEGHFEKPGQLKVYKNRDFCGLQVPNESLLVGPQRGLKNVVVVIAGARRETRENQLKRLVLDNRNCAFVPHVQIAPAESEILLLNSDPILHDVHTRIGSETLFNVGLPTWRQVKKRLRREGIVKVEYDVLHTWQSAYIVVTSSPYFAVTDEKEEFVIEGVPPGTYQMDVWHEQLGGLLKRVVVTGSGASQIDLVCASYPKGFAPGREEGRL
jgi:hypothetical protein